MKTRVPGLVCCLLAPLAPAVADSWSAAAVSNQSGVLADLDPNDGIAASVSFSNISTQTFVYAINAGPDATAVQLNRTRTTFVAISAVAPVPPEFDMSATASFAGGSLGALNAGVYVNVDGRVSAHTAFSYDVTLAPHTSYTLTGTVWVQGGSAGEPVGAYSQFASLEAGIDFSSPVDPNGDSAKFSVNVFPAPVTFAAMSFQDSKNYAYTFTNTSNLPLIGHVRAYASPQGQNSALPVPEAATNVMLLAGLGVLGFMVRGRRHQAGESLPAGGHR
jgi:hypothetical protein